MSEKENSLSENNMYLYFKEIILFCKRKNDMFGCFLFSFKSSISLLKTYGNSKQVAEPKGLNTGVGIRQWLLSLAHLYSLGSLFEEQKWLLLI